MNAGKQRIRTFTDEEDDYLDSLDGQFFNVSRIFAKLASYWEAIKTIPNYVKYVAQSLVHICSSRSNFRAFLVATWRSIMRLPVVVFYQYLWKTKKTQFFMNLFVGYALPIILENLPWYFSRRKIGRELRNLRNQIHNRMITGKELEVPSAKQYILMTVLYSFLETFDRHLKTRVSLMDRFLVKRLVLERILYSELWVMDQFQGRELEFRITNDISTTLHFFTFTVPAIFSSLYAIVRESMELYARKEQLDWVAIFRPFASMLSWRIIDWIKIQVIGRKANVAFTLTNPEVENLFLNVVDGLVDVQLNNLQESQLSCYDEVVSREFSTSESARFFLNRIYTTFTNRGVFDFLSDVYVTSTVMQKKNMNYEQYRKMQIDIDHISNLLRKLFNYLKSAKRVIQRQHRVVQLMSIPNFQDEDKILHTKVSSFNDLVLRNIKFTYRLNQKPPFALNFYGDVKFEPGKRYAVIGQNRSGKTTLMNLISKLYVPTCGEVLWNGIDYALIQRSSIRSIISYVSQRPFIFPGTIRENIKVGNTNATEEEIMEAAELAGLFTFDEIVKNEKKEKEEAPMISVSLIQLMPEHALREGKQIRVHFQFTEEDTTAVNEDADVPLTAEQRKRQVLDTVTQARGTNLSGGFGQSVALARIFLRKQARIIILDESTSAMDPIKKSQVIFPNLLSFVAKHNMALIIISHDMSVLEYVEYIILLEKGNIVCQGPLDKLQTEPKFREMVGGDKRAKL